MCTKCDKITQATKVEVRCLAMAGTVDTLPNAINNTDHSVLDPPLVFSNQTLYCGH